MAQVPASSGNKFRAEAMVLMIWFSCRVFYVFFVVFSSLEYLLLLSILISMIPTWGHEVGVPHDWVARRFTAFTNAHGCDDVCCIYPHDH
ncbi:hypothetical protein P154DRAFT_48544 [Amniculicola lignicola CBS 123094]|uniref:Uncharacterized protein n=1 Tax=Amniculicola lignicola CBS 123094 TaxID=1392246 RepID=A0A6A5VWU6_9PLEO|nr:hypothetical protein P154DRAFT_48544 [Amniculicola lignicola CBS 123094]